MWLCLLEAGRDGSTGDGVWLVAMNVFSCIICYCSPPYLTEAGVESLGHAHFLSGVHLPSSDGKPHPLVPDLCDNACLQVGPPPMEHWLEGGSLTQAFGAALTRLLVYHQTLADSYQG